MWKWIKRLIGLTFLLVIVLAVFLIPAKVSTQEQFKNVTVNTSLVDLAQEGFSTADVTASGLQTELQLNSPQLRQVIKSMAGEMTDETLLNTAVAMNGEYINVQVPIELGPVETMVSMDFSASVTDQQLTLNLERARLGHLPIPRSLVASKIAEKVNQEGTGATMIGNQIQLTMPTSGYRIYSAKVEKGNMVLQIIVPISY
ncbi:hypothetical protein BTU63_06700 [Streptococcus rubneri]|jgi:hypothetical protein|uniref:DUF2140 family protein n=1 Tax=Streptococcus rubneri TaxID=1234680 RepID=A0A4Z1DV97_9STRE|nr:hypothetical protein [Streptococcus rubneri]MBK4774589.1 hypothetical protein [Streptococcus rubneri]TGN91997.1 hypothetical protein E5S68_03370 [Streptococcus rubneri]